MGPEPAANAAARMKRLLELLLLLRLGLPSAAALAPVGLQPALKPAAGAAPPPGIGDVD
jgi:hypothetical protein